MNYLSVPRRAWTISGAVVLAATAAIVTAFVATPEEHAPGTGSPINSTDGTRGLDARQFDRPSGNLYSLIPAAQEQPAPHVTVQKFQNADVRVRGDVQALPNKQESDLGLPADRAVFTVYASQGALRWMQVANDKGLDVQGPKFHESDIMNTPNRLDHALGADMAQVEISGADTEAAFPPGQSTVTMTVQSTQGFGRCSVPVDNQVSTGRGLSLGPMTCNGL
jgi:hypothetical protein